MKNLKLLLIWFVLGVFISLTQPVSLVKANPSGPDPESPIGICLQGFLAGSLPPGCVYAEQYIGALHQLVSVGPLFEQTVDIVGISHTDLSEFFITLSPPASVPEAIVVDVFTSPLDVELNVPYSFVGLSIGFLHFDSSFMPPVDETAPPDDAAPPGEAPPSDDDPPPSDTAPPEEAPPSEEAPSPGDPAPPGEAPPPPGDGLPPGDPAPGDPAPPSDGNPPPGNTSPPGGSGSPDSPSDEDSEESPDDPDRPDFPLPDDEEEEITLPEIVPLQPEVFLSPNWLEYAVNVFSNKFPFDIFEGLDQLEEISGDCFSVEFFGQEFEHCIVDQLFEALTYPAIISFLFNFYMRI